MPHKQCYDKRVRAPKKRARHRGLVRKHPLLIHSRQTYVWRARESIAALKIEDTHVWTMLLGVRASFMKRSTSGKATRAKPAPTTLGRRYGCLSFFSGREATPNVGKVSTRLECGLSRLHEVNSTPLFDPATSKEEIVANLLSI